MSLAQKQMTDTTTLTKTSYAGKEDWSEFLKNGKTLDNVPYHTSWAVLFALLRKRNKFYQISRDIEQELKQNKHQRIYPKPEYVFSAFMITPARDVKVVFLGQDPYFKSEYDLESRDHCPQAMGMSFSVPSGITVPSSLDNIYANLVKYGHIDSKPRDGNLWFWAAQGCLMLNTALTVKHDDKLSHSGLWKWMTDEMIKYLSDNFDDIVFVLWGGHAYSKIDLIDQDRHHTVVSSHPSGLSCGKPFRAFPAFNNNDHFGQINDFLRESGKEEIVWGFKSN